MLAAWHNPMASSLPFVVDWKEMVVNIQYPVLRQICSGPTVLASEIGSYANEALTNDQALCSRPIELTRTFYISKLQ